nr:UDP-glycosyltransferase 91C1-like [Quercus suber]
MTAIPFLELSKKLAEKGIRISFISTPRNIQRLPSIPPNLAGNIKFVQLPLPSVHGLPENCEASIDLQQGKIQYLKKACDVLQAPFEKLVHKDPPDLILFDFIQCWAPETAAKFGQPDELKFLQKRTKIEDFENSDSHIDPNWCSTFHWLDKQGPKSVVFVGFGSEYKMPIEQVRELAYGVELSELPFIWILRKPEGVSSSEPLPDGFLARISNRGMLLVEKGIGFEIQRNKDGSFNQDVVAKSMRLVMVDKEEEPLRLKAAQMKTIFGNQNLHENYINDFIHYMGIYQQKGHQMPIKDAEKL